MYVCLQLGGSRPCKMMLEQPQSRFPRFFSLARQFRQQASAQFRACERELLRWMSVVAFPMATAPSPALDLHWYKVIMLLNRAFPTKQLIGKSFHDAETRLLRFGAIAVQLAYYQKPNSGVGPLHNPNGHQCIATRYP